MYEEFLLANLLMPFRHRTIKAKLSATQLTSLMTQHTTCSYVGHSWFLFNHHHYHHYISHFVLLDLWSSIDDFQNCLFYGLVKYKRVE